MERLSIIPKPPEEQTLSSATYSPPASAATAATAPPSALSSAAFPALPAPCRALHPSPPVHALLPATHLCIGGGVAIYHLATSRVVLCYHTRDGYFFLPKGRRDANEDSGAGAEREGFEESGYRNRLLPLPLAHIQPAAHDGRYVGGRRRERFVTEPVLTEMTGVGRGKSYLLHWYVAETVPRGVEAEVERLEVQREGKEEEGEGNGGVGRQGRGWVRARRWEEGMTMRERIALDHLGEGKEEGEGEAEGKNVIVDGGKKEEEEASSIKDAGQQKRRIYEPVRHENTGVDEEEALYESYLVPVEEAVRRLQGSSMEWVVRYGWEGIRRRWAMEEEEEE